MRSAPKLTAGRLVASLHVAGAVYLALVTPALAHRSETRPGGLALLGLVAAALGVVLWFLPWNRWPDWAPLVVVPEALALVTVHGWLSGAEGHPFSPLYLLVFAAIGLYGRPWVAASFSPLLLAAYLAPAFWGTGDPSVAATAALYAIPICVLVGESVAWLSRQRARAVAEHRSADQMLDAAFDHAPIGSCVLDAEGRILSMNLVLERLLGHPHGRLAGTRVLDVVHAGDRADCAKAGRLLWQGRVVTTRLECRLLDAARETVWVEVNASVAPDHTGEPSFMVAQVHDISDRRAYEDRLSYHAHHDALTGLPNRVLLLDRLNQALARAGDRPDGVALLFLDLDHFKLINDTYGHATGDALLVALAKCLHDAVRPSDTVVRLGGDEFVVLCEGMTRGEDAVVVAERIRYATAVGFDLPSGQLVPSVSIGIAVADRSSTPETLLRDADTAMYEAKQRGRARHEVFDANLRTRLVNKVHVEAELRGAIGRREMLLYFQPVIELTTGKVVAVEALLRWQRPGQGLTMPGEFIGVAEETGLINPLGEWAIAEACHQAATWRKAGRRVPVAVNVSARQLSSPDLLPAIDRALLQSNLPPELLCLELTESVLVDDTDTALGVLGEVKARGLLLALDDFGTGYASVSYLRQFPFDTLKIDRSFIRELGTKASGTALVAAILDMAEALGLATVAEGVENIHHLKALRSLGCTTAQGFLLAPPVPADLLDGLLDAVGQDTVPA